MIHKIKPETTLDTEAAIIGTAILHTRDPDDLVFVKMEVELTSHPAIPTGGSDLLFIRAKVPLRNIMCRNQGPDRTGLDALAAKYAITIFEGTIPGGHDLGFGSPVSLANRIVHLDLVAGLDAPAAENTAGKIPGNKGVDVLKNIGGLFGLKPSGLYPVFYGKCLQTTVSVCRTDILVLIPVQSLQLQISPGIRVHVLDQTVVISRGKQEFQVETTGLDHAGRVGGYDHIDPGWRGTGGHQIPRSLHFNQADSAGSRRCGPFEIT
jgi:hypothetical protein